VKGGGGGGIVREAWSLKEPPRMTDPARLAHVLRVQAPGGAEAEVSLALGATTAEAVGALCAAMGLEGRAQDLALFLREASGPRILQASERPLELCLRRADLPDGRAPFLLRRLPRASAGQRAPEGSPYALLAVAQGVEDYMRTPVPPPEDGAAEFASLRLLLDGEPLAPGVVARSIERYVHPGVRDRRTPKDWDVLVLSRARGHPRAQARRLLLEFVDGAELLEMAFFEAAHPSAAASPSSWPWTPAPCASSTARRTASSPATRSPRCTRGRRTRSAAGSTFWSRGRATGASSPSRPGRPSRWCL
ncbi:Hypothetical protein GSB_154008, partial [Giardia duodenalis]